MNKHGNVQSLRTANSWDTKQSPAIHHFYRDHGNGL